MSVAVRSRPAFSPHSGEHCSLFAIWPPAGASLGGPPVAAGRGEPYGKASAQMNSTKVHRKSRTLRQLPDLKSGLD
jgi:hypothetical protein